MSSKDPNTITLIETNEVNQPTATYIYTESQQKPRNGTRTGRIDLIPSTTPPSSSWSQANLINTLVDVFLPAGYPHSVSEDYLPYQIFDSLQAFSSSIAGLLASRAVLQGVGVGNPAATPTTALLLHILQDTTGRIATILFAHRVGTALEPECKRYRLAADVFNDLAMVLDCLSPLVPAGVVGRVGVLSLAGVLRALCGVAGGSSKASLSAHFARWGNLAEVNAKDSSQETIISLIGMLTGSLVVTYITSLPATWISLLVLLTLHLTLNYAAVRSVQMTSLNRQRANIAFSTLLESDGALGSLLSSPGVQAEKEGGGGGGEEEWKVLTPAQVAQRESIFERDGVLKWYPSLPSNSNTSPAPVQIPKVLGYGYIGISIHQFLTTTNTTNNQSTLPTLSNLFHEETYLLHVSHHGYSNNNNSTWQATILLKQSSTPRSQLKAWIHALLVCRVLSSFSPGDGNVLRVLEKTLAFLNHEGRFDKYMVALEEHGWDLDIAALETRSGRRVSLV